MQRLVVIGWRGMRRYWRQRRFLPPNHAAASNGRRLRFGRRSSPLRVWQRVAQLLPEERLAPVEDNVVLEQEPEAGIQKAALYAAKHNKYNLAAMAPVVHRLEQTRLVVVARPFCR